MYSAKITHPELLLIIKQRLNYSMTPERDLINIGQNSI